MAEILLSGLRNFRATIVCGSMLLCVAFLSFNTIRKLQIIPDSPFDYLLSFFPNYIPYILLFLFAYFIGVTYLTVLETVLDKLHQKTITAKVSPKKLISNLCGLFAPFSIKSIRRIENRIEKMTALEIISCSEIGSGDTRNIYSDDEKRLICRNVLHDLLWIEGRLIGGKLYEPFTKMRADAEFRVSFSIVLPFFAFGIMQSLAFHNFLRIIFFAIVIIASFWILLHGLYHYRKAYSMLAHYVADGELTTATLADKFQNLLDDRVH
jgi:hypothetical protein